MADMERPTVSVITVFLNAKRFLEEAAASVFAQTYPHWEYLLVDDGSTDRSVEIARSVTERHPDRVRYLEHPNRENRGISASRNLGVREAHGEFVCFLDADDVYRPGKLENQVRLLQEHSSAAMVYGVTEHWFSWTGRPEDAGRDQPKRLGVPPDTLVEPPTLVPLYLTGEAQTPGTSGFLVRREALLRVGGFEERFRAMSEDKVFFTKVALQYPIFVESGRWDLYRQHEESLSNEMRRAGQYRASGPSHSQRAYLFWLREHLRDNDINDTAVMAALQAALKPYHNRFTFALHVARHRVLRALGRLGILPSRP
jgi:glycosyltransferase involved in cell wall biosynthesis